MTEIAFVDSNILLYAHDRDAGVKRNIAQGILARLAVERRGALSMQVLQEFYANATRKLTQKLPKHEARDTVQDFAHWCVETTTEEILRAIEIESRNQLSFWDALIIAAAEKAGAAHILTEDLNHGQIIEGIRIKNPFKSHATIAPLGII
jgi:predicted nucleic acid-binding protein